MYDIFDDPLLHRTQYKNGFPVASGAIPGEEYSFPFNFDQANGVYVGFIVERDNGLGYSELLTQEALANKSFIELSNEISDQWVPSKNRARVTEVYFQKPNIQHSRSSWDFVSSKSLGNRTLNESALHLSRCNVDGILSAFESFDGFRPRGTLILMNPSKYVVGCRYREFDVEEFRNAMSDPLGSGKKFNAV